MIKSQGLNMGDAEGLLAELRRATRVNIPSEGGTRVVGWRLPETVAWPEGGTAGDALDLIATLVRPTPTVPVEDAELVDPRPSILAIIRATRQAGESEQVLARDLTTLFRALYAALSARNAVLEEALAEIADRPGAGMDYAKGCGEWPIDEAENMAKIARAALTTKETDDDR
jgi:hypothetical protein